MPDETPLTPDEPSPGVAGNVPVVGSTGGDVAQQAAQAAVAANVTFNSESILNVLQDLYGDAGLVGAGMASEHLDTLANNDFGQILPTLDWARWRPGDLDSARYVANGQLRETLDNAGIILRELTGSAIDRMGNVLANGLNEGLAPATIAQQMRDIVADKARALVISRTETGRAQVASSLDTYRANDTELVDWHSNPGACPACVELDANSPYSIDAVPAFPHHPNDRCQVVPHIDFGTPSET